MSSVKPDIRLFAYLLFLILSTASYMVESSELLGRWSFQSSNRELPDKCQQAYLDFVSISKIEGSDGSRTGAIEYSAEKVPSGEGYNLITKKVSNDGQPSCFGEQTSETDTGKLGFFYVMISPDGKLMKFYFSKGYYHVYKKSD